MTKEMQDVEQKLQMQLLDEEKRLKAEYAKVREMNLSVNAMLLRLLNMDN